MNDNDFQFGHKIRQMLDRGTENLDAKVTRRLHESRQQALSLHRVPVHGLQVAGVAHMMSDAVFGHVRILLAILALLTGAVGTYYWNQFRQADEFEEIDSALLTDDLPPAAYLDRGFHAWLERSSHSSQ